MRVCVSVRPQIAELQKELEPYLGLWHVVSEFALQAEDWLHGNMQSLNPEQIEELVSVHMTSACVQIIVERRLVVAGIFMPHVCVCVRVCVCVYEISSRLSVRCSMYVCHVCGSC